MSDQSLEDVARRCWRGAAPRRDGGGRRGGGGRLARRRRAPRRDREGQAGAAEAPRAARVRSATRSAVTSSADFSRDALEKLAADTCALARVIAPDPFGGLPDPAELATQIPDLDLYDPDVGDGHRRARHRVGEGGRAGGARRRCRASPTPRAPSSAPPPTTCSTRRASASAATIATRAVAVGGAGGLRRTARCSATTGTRAQRKLAQLEAPAADRPQGGGARAAPARTRGRSRPARCRSSSIRRWPPACCAISPARCRATRSTRAPRSSSASSGERIAPESVTVIDDGTLHRRPRARSPSTARACRRGARSVVERGVLTSYLFDTYSARKLQSRSTGNAARSVGSAPARGADQPLPRRPARRRPQEIIRSVPRGLVRHRADRLRRQPGHRRLLARRRRAVDRARRAGLPGRGDHHRRQPAGDVRRHRGRSATISSSAIRWWRRRSRSRA